MDRRRWFGVWASAASLSGALLAALALPAGASAAFDPSVVPAPCTYDASTARLSVTARYGLFTQLNATVDCWGDDTVPEDLAAVREIRLDMLDDRSGPTKSRLRIAPFRDVRDGNELKYFIDRVEAGIDSDLTIELNYDRSGASERGAPVPPLRVEAGGLDLNSDGDLDITVPAGQHFAVEIDSEEHPGSFDLRALPANPGQKVRVATYAGRGNVSFWGPLSGGNVVYYGGAGHDRVTTFGGDDAIDAGAGNNVISSGAGDDFAGGTAGNDVIDAGVGDDHVGAGNGNNVVRLGAGTNKATVGSGNDRVYGGPGRDRIQDGGGFHRISAGAGSDEIHVKGARGGISDCGPGLDYRDFLTVGKGGGSYRSCDRYGYERVHMPLKFQWYAERWAFRCADGIYRHTCPDPRRR